MILLLIKYKNILLNKSTEGPASEAHIHVHNHTTAENNPRANTVDTLMLSMVSKSKLSIHVIAKVVLK